MKNVLAFIGAAVVAFLAVGWYLGWYQVSRSPSDGKQSLHLDINADKISSDVKQGVEKGSDFVDQIRDKSKGDQQTKPGPATNFFTPTPTPSDKDNSGGWRPIGDK
jgi:hypothetical protein